MYYIYLFKITYCFTIIRNLKDIRYNYICIIILNVKIMVRIIFLIYDSNLKYSNLSLYDL